MKTKKQKQKTEYVVKTASACMPASCWGKYGRVAIVEIEAGSGAPSRIDEREKNVVAITRLYDRLFWGTSDRCAYRRALALAGKMCEGLNAGRIQPASVPYCV